MSRLIIRGHLGYEFTMNVLQFRSPMSAAINSVQTRTMLQHFPIRAGQPDIEFTVKFAHREDKTRFQAFVREHQVRSLDDPNHNAVTLSWANRNIENWTGYICGFPVAERKFEYSPNVTFGVDLIHSLMSTKTTMSSRGSDWTAIWGPQIGPYIPMRDWIFRLPSLTQNAPSTQNEPQP